MTADPVAALLAELPQREHVPRRYLGPQGPDWTPYHRRPAWGWRWSKLLDDPDPTPYTEEWYALKEGTPDDEGSRRRAEYAARVRARHEGTRRSEHDWWGPTHNRRRA